MKDQALLLSPGSEPRGITTFISNLEYLITINSKTIPGRWFYDINLNVVKDIVVPGNDCINKLIKSLSLLKPARTPEEQTTIVKYLVKILTSDECARGGADISALTDLETTLKQKKTSAKKKTSAAKKNPAVAIPA